MSRTLTSNVFVADEDDPTGRRGTWYGPAHGNAEVDDDVAARITNPAAWETDEAGNGFAEVTATRDETGEIVDVSYREVTGPPEADAPQTGDAGTTGSAGDDGLDDMDKDALVAYAEAAGIDVDKRKGEDSIRASIREAKAGA